MASHVEDGHVTETLKDKSQAVVNGLAEKVTNGDKPATNGHTEKEVPDGQTKTALHTSSKEPLQLKGVLDEYKSFDVTPTIGKEFPDADLSKWLRAPNSDELIRDLAITGQ